jgi:beta-galactosidase
LAFNREFGLDYWSNRVDNWDDFPDIRGTINQSLAAEYARFQRKLVTDFLKWQADIVSKYKRPNQFITHNFDYAWTGSSFGVQPEVDQFAAVRCMDVAGCDIYHPSQGELTGCEITVCGNISRGLLRSNYLVLETEAQGNPGWLPYPGQLKLQAYSHIANGSNCVEYWHWHSIHNAIESYWKGVLSHDFSENETYRECTQIGNEWKRIGSKLKNLQKTNRVAVMADHSSLTALTQFPTETLKEHSYNTVFRWLCDALFRMNIEYDIIPADGALLSNYDCVLVPTLYSAPEDLLLAMDSYVKNGGNLVMTFKSAFSDEHLKIYHDTQPHILHNTFGVHYDQFTYPKHVDVAYRHAAGAAKEWMEMVVCDTAKPLIQYAHPVWNRYTAAAENAYGKGHTLYLATLFDDPVLTELLKKFFSDIRLSEPDKLPFNVKYPVSIKQGINDDGKHIVYFLNYSADRKTVTNTCGTATELIGGVTVSAGESLTLAPWGVAVLEYL